MRSVHRARLRARLGGDEREAVVIKVRIRGGIPEDKLERIFEEYYQIGPQGTQRLGCRSWPRIVREVSRLLGYSVSVTSTPGKGTCVSVRVPGHRAVPTADMPVLQDPAPKMTSPPSGAA